jgi:hypothetical protein
MLLTETTLTHNGFCNHCAQGREGRDGFAIIRVDGTASHWLCRAGGSIDVTIRDANSNVVFENAVAIGA